jgi:hypothetical protein
LVDEGNGEQYTAIWSQGVGPKSPTTTTIIEYASDTGAISNVIWRLKRNGTGTLTSYSLFPVATDEKAFDFKGIETYELEKTATRQVKYAEQESFYMGLETEETASASVEW